jgi:hypothetical protein
MKNLKSIAETWSKSDTMNIIQLKTMQNSKVMTSPRQSNMSWKQGLKEKLLPPKSDKVIDKILDGQVMNGKQTL